jgi:hypothetical protein
MSQQNFKKSTAVIFCAALAACGGGGGGGDTPAQAGTSTGNSTASTGSGTTNQGTGTPVAGAPTSPSGTATGNSSSPANGSGTITTPSSGSGTTTSGPTAPAFTAQLVAAPPSSSSTGRFLGDNGGITYSDTEYFEVSGTGLRNVELVSANDVSIKYGTFTISADGTRATLNWRYDVGNYIIYNLRILAWDVPAGEAGESIEVMPARDYRVRVSAGRCASLGRPDGSCGDAAP